MGHQVSMLAVAPDVMRKDFESTFYGKSRVAARLILKARSGRSLTPRQRKLAASLAEDSGVTPRLIQQAINQLERVADITKLHEP
jgi:hypothetical protein